jgi:methionyl-tRNA formyltransferase
MKIVFMGTPEFAIPSLDILLRNSFNISAVVTAPDKPRGRGYVVSPSPVKTFAIEKGLRVLQPEKLKDEKFLNQLREIAPDLIIVVAFRILPREVFSMPPLGTVNLHASLLPKYRGAAPINWAIINGEKETGVTTFFINERVDTGDIILQRKVPIGCDETAGELHDKLADIGAELLLETVRLIQSGKVKTFPQSDSLASSAPKITKDMCKIDWGSKTAVQVHNFVRGLSPVPGAFTFLSGKLVKIYRTKVVESDACLDSSLVRNTPGGIIVLDDVIYVLCSDGGFVKILELQVEGRRRLKVDEFLRGYRLKTGDKFE